MGFYPINASMARAFKVSNDGSTSESKQQDKGNIKAVQFFMSNTMQMPDYVIDTLHFMRAFYPTSGSGSNVMYVEFGTEEDIIQLRRYAQNLSGTAREDPRTVQYVPKSLQKHHNDLQQVAYAARRMQPKMSSKIWIEQEMELRLKPAGDPTPWQNVKPVNLKEFWTKHPSNNHKKTTSENTTTHQTKQTTPQEPTDSQGYTLVERHRGYRSSPKSHNSPKQSENILENNPFNLLQHTYHP